MDTPQLPNGYEWYFEYPPDQADRLRQTMELYAKLDVPQDSSPVPQDGQNHWSTWAERLGRATGEPVGEWIMEAELDEPIDFSIRRGGIQYPIDPQLVDFFEREVANSWGSAQVDEPFELTAQYDGQLGFGTQAVDPQTAEGLGLRPCFSVPCPPFNEVDLGSPRPVGWYGIEFNVLRIGDPYASWPLDLQVDELWKIILNQAQEIRVKHGYSDDTLISVGLPNNPELARVLDAIKHRAARPDSPVIVKLARDE